MRKLSWVVLSMLAACTNASGTGDEITPLEGDPAETSPLPPAHGDAGVAPTTDSGTTTTPPTPTTDDAGNTIDTSTPPTDPPPPPTAKGKGRIVGYYTNWAQYRPGGCKFTPDDIDATKLTHLDYAFAKIEVTGTKEKPTAFKLAPYEWNDIGEPGGPPGMYAKTAALKAKNPALKTLIAVGGWNFNEAPATQWIFSAMVENEALRKDFVKTSIAYARTHAFDGIDLDWEYPAKPEMGGRPQDRANFTKLLADFRTQIEAEAKTSGKDKLLLTIAAAAGEPAFKGYELDQIHKYLDWINLMTYDYHGSWDPKTGSNAPLRKDTNPGGNFYVAYTVKAYLDAGTPPDKLVLGLATYGRSWAGVITPKIDSAAAGTPKSGKCTGAAGFLAYHEIKDLLAAGWKTGWDTTSDTPFAYDASGEFVSYEDFKSIDLKLDFMHEKKLGGAMIWALDLDDFKGGYPLLTAIGKRVEK